MKVRAGKRPKLADNAVGWGVERDAEMSRIIQRYMELMNEHGVSMPDQDTLIRYLEMASVRQGYMEGMPDDYQKLYQQ